MVWNGISICGDQKDATKENIYIQTPLNVDNLVRYNRVERKGRCDQGLDLAIGL
jgi:hypothetical protein